MMNQTESFGVRLAQLRRDAGLSQQGLAQALSVTRQAVSNWERDQTVPDLDMLRSIAAALCTDMNTLCGMDVLPRRKPRRTLPRPALALSLCAAFCLGAGLGLWSSRTPPEPVPDATVSTTLSAHRISYTTPSGIKVTTAADGALEVSDELAALPEQDPGPVELFHGGKGLQFLRRKGLPQLMPVEVVELLQGQIPQGHRTNVRVSKRASSVGSW